MHTISRDKQSDPCESCLSTPSEGLMSASLIFLQSLRPDEEQSDRPYADGGLIRPAFIFLSSRRLSPSTFDSK